MRLETSPLRVADVVHEAAPILVIAQTPLADPLPVGHP